MSQDDFIGRRGEISAELFLQTLRPQTFLQVTGPDAGYDFFLGFRTSTGRVVTIAVQVKSTQDPVDLDYRLRCGKALFDKLTKSNLPVLLVIVDVKLNETYFAWTSELVKTAAPSHGSVVAKVALRKVTPNSSQKLLQEIERK